MRNSVFQICWIQNGSCLCLSTSEASTIVAAIEDGLLDKIGQLERSSDLPGQRWRPLDSAGGYAMHREWTFDEEFTSWRWRLLDEEFTSWHHLQKMPR
jgi:hypothetical protein